MNGSLPKEPVAFFFPPSWICPHSLPKRLFPTRMTSPFFLHGFRPSSSSENPGSLSRQKLFLGNPAFFFILVSLITSWQRSPGHFFPFFLPGAVHPTYTPVPRDGPYFTGIFTSIPPGTNPEGVGAFQQPSFSFPPVPFRAVPGGRLFFFLLGGPSSSFFFFFFFFSFLTISAFVYGGQ